MAPDSLTDLTGTKAGSTQVDIINRANNQRDALIRKNSDSRPRLQIRIPIALDTARTAQNPFIIGDPFTGFYVETATDALANIKMSFTSPEDHNTINYTTIYQKDSMFTPEPIKGCLLTWPAQTGKTMTLVLYVGVDFRPGSYLSAVSGTVVIGYGSQMTPSGVVSVATTVTLILAADSTRKRATIKNIGTSEIYLSGTSSVVSDSGAVVGSLVGIQLIGGATYEWENTGAIYGIAEGSASLVSINVEA